MTNILIKQNVRRPKGTLTFPGDKSLSHRAIIFGSLAEGTSTFTNVLMGEDCMYTREAFASMGIEIQSTKPTSLTITGRGLHALTPPKKELCLGNSGTSMRLLLGVLAGQPFTAKLTGDPSLSNRPMRRVTDFLIQMGAHIEGRDNGNFAPLTIRGGSLKAIDAKLPVASAQVKSALLLAGLYADGTTRVTEPLKSRDHTERFLSFFGARVSEEGNTVSVRGGQTLKARQFEIAGDISSAAFFMALAALLPGSDIFFQSVLWNPLRTGVVKILNAMGVKIKVHAKRQAGPEPVADFTLKSGYLNAFRIPKNDLPTLIDEIPILLVLATQADGTSIVEEADELRVKETDRIQSMVTTLSAMGAKIRTNGNTLIVQGRTPLSGATVDSFKDHRTAMSLVIAGLIAKGETLVKDVDCINTSFPNFFDLLAKLGIHDKS